MARQKKPSGRNRRSRSARDLRRIYGKREPRKVILVLCEGEKTEPGYFKALRREVRLYAVDIRVIGKGKAPITMVQDALRARDQLGADVDEIWCVFDTETGNQNPRLGDAITLAANNDIGLAVSCPAFEYWFFIHFECSDRVFTSVEDLISCLRGHIPDYEKGARVFPIIWERTADAIGHVEKLRRNAVDPWDEFPNPSTTVDVLVSRILSFAD